MAKIDNKIIPRNFKGLPQVRIRKLVYHFNSKIRNDKISIFWDKNVAIYAYSLGKCLHYGKYTGVKDLTNIMSAQAISLLSVCNSVDSILSEV